MDKEILSIYRLLKLQDRQMIRDTTIHMNVLTSKIKEYTDKKVLNVRPLKLGDAIVTAKNSFLGTVNTLILGFPKYVTNSKIKNIVDANASKYHIGNIYNSEEGKKCISKYVDAYDQMLMAIEKQECEDLIGDIEHNVDYQDVDNRRLLHIVGNNVQSLNAYLATIDNRHLNFYLLFAEEIPETAVAKLKSDHTWEFTKTYMDASDLNAYLARYRELGTLEATLKEKNLKLIESNKHVRETIKTSYMRQNYKREFNESMKKMGDELMRHDQKVLEQVHQEQRKLYDSVG